MKKRQFINKPNWFDVRMDGFGKLLKVGKVKEMQKLMGVKRVSVHTICQYLMRVECHLLFEEGNSYSKVAIILDMPQGTVHGYYLKYKEEFPDGKGI